MRISRFWLLSCCGAAVVAAICVGSPEPARAQFGFDFRGIPIDIYFGGRYRGRHYGRQRRGAPKDDSNQNEDRSSRSNEKADKVLASLGAPSSSEQSRVLKGISASPVLGVVGSTKDLQDVAKPKSQEDDRDYTGALDQIVRELAEKQDSRLGTAGDVTATGIEQSLTKAIKNAKLDTFERFVSESWTSDRIRKLVLDRAYNDIKPLLSGNTRGQVRMEAIDAVIQRVRRNRISPHLRNVRTAGGQSRRQPVHPAPLSGDCRARRRADARHRRYPGAERFERHAWRGMTLS